MSMSSVTETSTSDLGKQGEMLFGAPDGPLWVPVAFGWPLHGRTLLGDTSLQFEHARLRARQIHLQSMEPDVGSPIVGKRSWVQSGISSR
jgi:hypothetical protein